MDCGNVEKIYETMQKFHKMKMNLNDTGEITRGEIMMLKMIKANSSEHEGVTISTLSELLNISKPAVSQVLNTLEDKKYVERSAVKNDRRLVHVRLTGSGEECLARKYQAQLLMMNKVFDRMGEDDTKQLLQLLEKLYTIVSDL